MSALVRHPVLWTSPTPLWGRFGATVGGASYRADDQARPAILRFASDEFMQQLLAMLDANPRQLGDVIARPETWRTPMGETPDLRLNTPVPRLARSLWRSRQTRLPVTTLGATTSDDQITENSQARNIQLKLYHPAHQRHYLVGANLVCGIPGYPDRAIATGGREQVGFVMRRLLRPNGSNAAEEFAFVKNASGTRWQRLPPNATASDPFAQLGDGEELLPLFPLNYRDDTDHPRRMMSGLVPVGRREEYMSTRVNKQAPTTSSGASTGSTASTTGNGTPPTAISERLEQFRMEVSEPWKNLVRLAYSTADRINDPDPNNRPTDAASLNDSAARLNRQLQHQSWLVLLNFADYLATHIPSVLSATSPGDLATTGQQQLFTWLQTPPGTYPIVSDHVAWPIAGGSPPPVASTIQNALKDVIAARDSIEATTASFPQDPGPNNSWPQSLCVLAGVSVDPVNLNPPQLDAGGLQATLGLISGLPSLGTADDDTDPISSAAAPLARVEAQAALLDILLKLVIAAIDTSVPAQPAPPLPFARQLRDALNSIDDPDGWFVMRCVYVRCDCGPLQPTVLSAASQRFQLASFFDPDAPARPIRIALPLDTTPAGLRKFNKNTAFMISDVLCGQVQRAKGLGFVDLVRAVLPWPLHKDLDVGDMGPCSNAQGNIGMICSLSIPIITICALILLSIIVLLLDLIFRWIPWFIICFPVPGLKAKRT